MRNLIRRFVEAGVPGYHIEDQKPGTEEVRHQGGKVLVPRTSRSSVSTRRVSSSTSWVCRGSSSPAPMPSRPRSSTGAATSATSRSSSGDQRDLPSYKVGYLALLRRFHEARRRGDPRAPAVRRIRRPSTRGLRLARARRAVINLLEERRRFRPIRKALRCRPGARQGRDARLVEAWQAEAGLKTFPRRSPT